MLSNAQQTQIPTEVHQAATTYELGTPLREFKPKLTISDVGSGLFLIAIGIACFIMGQLRTPDQRLIAFLIGALMVVLGCSIFLLKFLARNWRVYVCNDGLLSLKKKASAIRWDSADAFWKSVTRHYRNGSYTGTTHRYTLRSTSGEQVVFDDTFPDVEELGKIIDHEVTNHLLPKYIERYNAGNVVSFEKLSVSREGISNGKETIAWDQAKAIRISNGTVEIKKDGKWLNWASVQVASIPNFTVFLALVSNIADIQVQ